MADFSGLIGRPAEFRAFDVAAEGLERNRVRSEQLAEKANARKAASASFVKNYLDPKDYLTGTNYDPEIVSRINKALQTGADLAAKGADTASIMMALGPQVNQLGEYSTKAKLINQQIKSGVEKLKPYGGYNLAALQQEALKGAFQNPDGTMRDISTVDPNTDWISQTIQNNPEAVTTGAGLDDFVKKTPTATYSRTATTSHQGTTKNTQYDAVTPFWMDLERDDQGNVVADASGNPVGLDVVSSSIIGDDGKPILDPTTNKPFRAMDKRNFDAVMKHNPDIADFVRGQVNRSFREAGAKDIPKEGSPQWDMRARSLLYDELKTRDKSSFKVKDQERQNAQAVKIEIAKDPTALKLIEKFHDATRKDDDGGTNNSLKQFKVNPIEAIGRVFSNDPEYTAGEQKTVDGRQVIDVTSVLPGGGLKKGRGEDEVFKSIYFDPNKRSLIVEQEVKDQFGMPKKSMEEVSESTVPQFMRKIAEANGVPLTAVKSLLDKMGYAGGKFSNVGQARALNEPEPEPIDTKKMSFKDMKNLDTPEGKVVEAGERSRVNPKRYSGGAFYVEIKGSDGKTTTKNFSSREEMDKYLSTQPKKEAAPAATNTPKSSGSWRDRAKKVQ